MAFTLRCRTARHLPVRGQAAVRGVTLAIAIALCACKRTPSFKDEVLPVMLRHCASAEGCHGDKPTDSVDLDLRAANAWTQLVGAPAEARKGALRVRPGEPSGSFLLAKLKGALSAGEGKAMPIDEDTGVPIVPSPLPLSSTLGS